MRALLAGRPIDLAVEGDGLVVRTARGEPLDLDAAGVLLALGGTEPDWLRPVEGLHAAYAAGASLADLAGIADLVSRKRSARPEIARTTTDPLLLVAFAGAGEAAAARNPACTPHVWGLLANHRDERVPDKARRAVDVLPPALAEYPDPFVRERVARNPACPPDVLARLAFETHVGVVAEVASNPATPPGLLAHLARRMLGNVDEQLAANPRTPPNVLNALARQHSPQVRAAAARNPALPRTAVRRLVRDPAGSVLVSLAQRGDLGPRALAWTERYARRTDAMSHRLVRWRVEHHPNTSERTARRLAAMSAAIDAAGRRPGAGGGRPGRPWARSWWRRGARLWLPPTALDVLVLGPLVLLSLAAVAAVPAVALIVVPSLLLLAFARFTRRLRPRPASPRTAARQRRSTASVAGLFLVLALGSRLANLVTNEATPGRPAATPFVNALYVTDSPVASRVRASAGRAMTEARLPAARDDALRLAADLESARGDLVGLDDSLLGALRDSYGALREALLVAARAPTAAAWDAEERRLRAAFQAVDQAGG